MLFLAWMVGLGRFRLYEGLGGLVLSLWMSVVLLDVVDFYEAHASKGILKLLALVLAAMAGNLLLSQASLEVNGITAEDPSKFPRTVAFAMVCGFPLALGLFAFIAMMAQIAVLPFVGVIAMIRDFGISRDLSKTDRRRRIFLALRYFSSLVVSALVWQWTQQIHSAYEDTINGVVESFLFKAEMYDNSNCTMKRGERVAFLPDHKVLAGIRVGSGYHFTERACRPGNGAEDDHGQ